MIGPILYCKTCGEYVTTKINENEIMCPHVFYHHYHHVKENLDKKLNDTVLKKVLWK